MVKNQKANTSSQADREFYGNAGKILQGKAAADANLLTPGIHPDVIFYLNASLIGFAFVMCCFLFIDSMRFHALICLALDAALFITAKFVIAELPRSTDSGKKNNAGKQAASTNASATKKTPASNPAPAAKKPASVPAPTPAKANNAKATSTSTTSNVKPAAANANGNDNKKPQQQQQKQKKAAAPIEQQQPNTPDAPEEEDDWEVVAVRKRNSSGTLSKNKKRKLKLSRSQL